MRVTRLPVPLTPRLQREAARWLEPAPSRPAPEPLRPGQTSVWSFPRPPAVERVHERTSVHFAGRCVASTHAALRVCETAAPPTYYLPREAFEASVLVETDGSSHCEWKGVASYQSLRVGARVAWRAGWSYAAPHAEYAVLAGHVGVYAGRVDRCEVAGEVVRPQPGGFYAGWITSDLAGPFKGEPGSQGW